MGMTIIDLSMSSLSYFETENCTTFCQGSNHIGLNQPKKNGVVLSCGIKITKFAKYLQMSKSKMFHQFAIIWWKIPVCRKRPKNVFFFYQKWGKIFFPKSVLYVKFSFFLFFHITSRPLIIKVWSEKDCNSNSSKKAEKDESPRVESSEKTKQ